MNKKLLLLLFISIVSKAWLAAQVDTIPDLIISEQRMDWSTNAYIELTNMGDSALDLSQFILSSPYTDNNRYYFEPNTMLNPKKTVVLANYWDEVDRNWVELQAKTDFLVWQDDASELTIYDSISVGAYLLQSWGGKYSTLLWYKWSDVDSMIIDCFNYNTDANGSAQKVLVPVAGVPEAVNYNTLVRKFNIVQGNLGNWDASRGTDAAESEWLLAEHLTPQHGLPFTTVGNHGNYSIDVTAANPDIVLDIANGTLTAPWGIIRGDSLIKNLNLGDGMAWSYLQNPVFEDSIHTIMQTGDKLQLKSFGTAMTLKELSITVTDPKDDMNLVFPRRSTGPLNADIPGSITVIKGVRYYVTNGEPTMDTIGNVPFAARVDTLFKYIEWASNASAKIIWKDGTERVDLMNGDILEVTAANSSKKQYYIDVQEYSLSDNVSLSAIIWPDITMQDRLFDLNWITDTIPGFAPNITSYTVKLRSDTKNVPAFKAYSQDLNARISYKPAVSLKGGFDERTTVITVTSESDTLTKKYYITFAVEVNSELMQSFKGEPFFTEFQSKTMTQVEVVELANPGTESLDLSKYLIARINGSDPVSAITQNLDYINRYSMYVPGYRFTDDTASWQKDGVNGADYKKLVKFDGDVDPNLEANGDVFVIAGGDPNKLVESADLDPSVYNLTFPIDYPNVWGIQFPKNTGLTQRNNNITLYLFRIDNDTILSGDKAIGDINDLTLIDVLGHNDGTNYGSIAGYTGPINKGFRVIRKPNIWRGNTSYLASGGTTLENSEWLLTDPTTEGLSWSEACSTIGNHKLDPVTAYISTVSSLKYLVDRGYQGKLGITGIGNGETVQQFYDNLIIPDTAQTLTVKNSSDGAPRALADAVAAGDTLVVIAADGKSTTKYVLDITPLDNNVSLVAVSGSGLTITANTVTGFILGTTLKTVMEGVKPGSDLAIMNIIDATGALVPLQEMDANGVYLPVLATKNMFFEVVAQNGNRASYQLIPGSQVGDAFVVSSVYAIDQDHFVIAGVPGGISVSKFLANLTAAEGATVTILDKAAYKRAMGNLSIDDVLKVVSSDGSKTVIYMLYFVDEVNVAPSVSVAETDIAAASGVAVSVSATVTDDGLPIVPGVLSYTWTVSVGSAANVSIAAPTEATTNVTFTADGFYVLQIKVSDGELDGVATVNVTVTGTGIESNSAAFRMYPNPANETITLEMGNRGNEIPVISIYSITGKIVYKEIAENNIKVIDVSRLDKGLYFVKIENGTETITKKLSIVK